METEVFQHIDLLLGGVPYTGAAQLQRVGQLGHYPVQIRMVKGAQILSQQIHKAESTLFGHIQRDEAPARFQSLFADSESLVQIIHIAGAAVEVNHIVGIFLQVGILDSAESDDVHTALLGNRAHIAGRLDALDAAVIDHALKQAAAAAHRKHALAGNIPQCPLEQPQLTLEQVVVFHKPGIILGCIAIKFGFHFRRFLSFLACRAGFFHPERRHFTG